jgi:glutathione S-transferase
MITLYGFGRIFREAHGETKDLRAQWALEETGLPYRVHALDHTGGELDGEAYSRISPFHQAPVIDDDGFVVAESAAVVLYLAEKAGKIAARWLDDVERRLEGREWIACHDFTVADILMACVLRSIRKTDLMEPYPRIQAYYERTQVRPAWQRTLGLYAERVGVSVDDIR